MHEPGIKNDQNLQTEIIQSDSVWRFLICRRWIPAWCKNNDMIFLNDDVIKPESDKGFVKIKRVWKQSILYFFFKKRNKKKR